MPRINVDSSYFNHPKTRRLKVYIDCHAEIYPIKLWAFCAEYFPKDGCLHGYSGNEIEGILDYIGPSGNLIRALETVGFIEKIENDYVVHDWKEHAGFVWNYMQAGRKGGKKSGLSRRKNKSKQPLKRNAKSLEAKCQIASTMEWNGMEWNKDSIEAPKNGASNPPSSEPKPLTPLAKVVYVYKLVSGHKKDDKAWDALNFKRCARSAKQLLTYFGKWEDAADCVEDVYKKLNGKGLTVTLETVVKHASDWLKDKREQEARHGVPPWPPA